MKWIVSPVVWLAALVVALAVLWRFGRGRNIVLRDRFSPKFVRMVVVLLVLLGAGADSKSADPSRRESANDGSRVSAPKRNETIPDVLNARTIRQWRYFTGPSSAWRQTKLTLVLLENLSSRPDQQVQMTLDDAVNSLPRKFRAMVAAEVESARTGQPKPTVTAVEITLVLEELERGRCFDNWAMGYLWRKTAQLPKTRDDEKVVELYAALHRHTRVANTLIRAETSVRPPVFRPWLSKAGPSVKYMSSEDRIRANLLKAAARIYPDTDSGTWQREATAVFAIDKDSPPATLIRAGSRLPLVPSKTVRINRLDLIEPPPGKAQVALEHDWLGPIKLPPGRTLTVWDLPKLLSAAPTAKVRQASADALKGDEQAIERLERVLPLCHPPIRTALSESPNAAGASRLRTILTLFDDSIVREPVSPHVPR